MATRLDFFFFDEVLLSFCINHEFVYFPPPQGLREDFVLYDFICKSFGASIVVEGE